MSQNAAVSGGGGGGGGSTTTMNPSDLSGASLTLGNLQYNGGAGSPAACRSVGSNTSGKHYFEAKVVGDGGDTMLGIADATAPLGTWMYNSNPSHGSVLWLSSANLYYNVNATASGIGAAVTNDIIQVAYDATNGIIWVGRNNTWMGSPSAGTGGLSVAALAGTAIYAFVQGDSTSDKVLFNFGGSAYAYTPPTGFGNW